MENYAYNSYPDSRDSSPRSREIEFENPPPWDVDQQSPQNYKVKFMCSYGGKINPRPHDNQLSYIGGETKILSVDRNIKFSAFMAKLAQLSAMDVSFKYQLPGEELDALISVTNDDDLEHMMHEIDRLQGGLVKASRMRLFLFPVGEQSFSFGSESGKSEKDQFVEALNSAPSRVPPQTAGKSVPAGNNVDFLFGTEKGVPTPVLNKLQEPVPAPAPEFDRVVGSDPGFEIQRQMQEFQRLQIGGHDQYRRKSDDNMMGFYTGDYYKVPEKMPQVSAPGGYWPEKQVHAGGFPATVTGTHGPPDQHQPMYMISAPAPVYHTAPPMVRPTGQPGQGYYPMQRMGHDIYREQQMYNVVPPPQQAMSAPQQPPQQPKVPGYTEGIPMARPGMGMAPDTGAYPPQMPGRQVYYTPAGGMMVPSPYQGGSPAGSGGGIVPEGKVATKVPQGSV